MLTTEFLSDKIEKYIENISFDLTPKTLYDPISYILSIGGKRIRPLLTLLAANLFSENIERAIEPAIGIEIFHNFTLLHDDLMDESDMRRGKATVHKKWNNNTAILSGDAMLIEAYKYMLSVEHKLLPQVLEIFSNTALDVCKGQQFDMDYEKRVDVTESEYLEMIKLKTAVLLAGSLKIGAIIAGATTEDSDLLYNFGINIGLAFQIKDDLLDVYGDSITLGKNIGDDIVNNKKTFLLIKALELSDNNQKKELIQMISDNNVDHSIKINKVKKIYDALNIKALSEKLIEDFYNYAIHSLDLVSVEPENKKNLKTLAHNLMYREK